MEVQTIGNGLLENIKDILNAGGAQSSVVPTSTPVTVDDAEGGTSLIAANPDRLSVTLQNVGIVPCLICLGDDASDSNYSAVLAADTDIRAGKGGVIEIRDYLGSISGITEADSTDIAVTEITKT